LREKALRRSNEMKRRSREPETAPPNGTKDKTNGNLNNEREPLDKRNLKSNTSKLA